MIFIFAKGAEAATKQPDAFKMMMSLRSSHIMNGQTASFLSPHLTGPIFPDNLRHLLTDALRGATRMNHTPSSAAAKRDIRSHCAQVLI